MQVSRPTARWLKCLFAGKSDLLSPSPADQSLSLPSKARAAGQGRDAAPAGRTSLRNRSQGYLLPPFPGGVMFTMTVRSISFVFLAVNSYPQPSKAPHTYFSTDSGSINS